MASDLLETAAEIKTAFFIIQGRDGRCDADFGGGGLLQADEGTDKEVGADQWQTFRLHD